MNFCVNDNDLRENHDGRPFEQLNKPPSLEDLVQIVT